MRGWHNVDRLDSHFVAPVPPVSLGYLAKNMVMKKRIFGVIGYSVLLLVVLAALGIGWGLQSQSFAEDATDLYFKTAGIPEGPPAPSPQETVYARIGSFDSRLVVWFVTQLHTYFGGFVLALPILCVAGVSWAQQQKARTRTSL